MKTITTFVITFLLITASLSIVTRPEPTGSTQPQPNLSKEKGQHRKGSSSSSGGGGGGGSDGGAGGFFGPGAGFNIPGFGSGWGSGEGGGYGAGYGGPKGGYSKGGIVRPTVVCKDKGPCYQQKLTCPSKCFSSYSRSGKNYGTGGGGGGCTIDCKKKCVAYC